MNLIKLNFSRNKILKSEVCIKIGQKEIDNEHLTFCKKLNSEKDYRFSHILNRNLKEKIETLKKIEENEEDKRNKERVDPEIQ